MMTFGGRGKFHGAVSLLVVLAAGCTQFAVRADRAPDADFSRYRTFAWMTIAAAPPADQDTGSRGIDDRIYSAVESAMHTKGYTPAASTAADLLVTFRLLRQDGYDDEHISYMSQWNRGAYLNALHASSDSYVRGTLLIDVVDRATNTLVWRSSASARLLPHLSYEAKVERAQEAVEQMLETFPAR